MPKPTRRTKDVEQREARRARVVWGALLASMTVVGGFMAMVRGGAPRLDGFALPALASATVPASIEAALRTRVPVDRARWTSIVIHHSGSTAGTPASIEASHRAMNLNGLGYHFVIGNGRGIDDGEVHVGYRWLDQLPGAHVGGPNGPKLNQSSIGICLVGDGTRKPFSAAQIQRLAELVASLSRDLGIPQDRIVLHSDVAPTEDPGRFFPKAAFREQLAALR